MPVSRTRIYSTADSRHSHIAKQSPDGATFRRMFFPKWSILYSVGYLSHFGASTMYRQAFFIAEAC
jgi:hypothetical protein